MNKLEQKCGFVAIIGIPNAGKSTLLNAIIGQKISIVTPKPQTTRSRIRGIKNIGNSQIVFIDTPGIFKINSSVNNRLNRSIVETAKNALEGIDFIIHLHDASKPIDEDEENLIQILSEQKNIRKILVLNKVDKIKDKSKLLTLTTRLNELNNYDATFMISAIKGQRIDDILKYLDREISEGEWAYPDDEVSDVSIRSLAAEITREKLFFNLNEELPYNTYVETEKFEETANSIKINQAIYTVSEAHKKIIIGNNGSLIKKIGEAARKEIEYNFGKKIHLFLFVKVRENWMESKEAYIESGVDFVK